MFASCSRVSASPPWRASRDRSRVRSAMPCRHRTGRRWLRAQRRRAVLGRACRRDLANAMSRAGHAGGAAGFAEFVADGFFGQRPAALAAGPFFFGGTAQAVVDQKVLASGEEQFRRTILLERARLSREPRPHECRQRGGNLGIQALRTWPLSVAPALIVGSATAP